MQISSLNIRKLFLTHCIIHALCITWSFLNLQIHQFHIFCCPYLSIFRYSVFDVTDVLLEVGHTQFNVSRGDSTWLVVLQHPRFLIAIFVSFCFQTVYWIYLFLICTLFWMLLHEFDLVYGLCMKSFPQFILIKTVPIGTVQAEGLYLSPQF